VLSKVFVYPVLISFRINLLLALDISTANTYNLPEKRIRL
jgi:hypothetical protein